MKLLKTVGIAGLCAVLSTTLAFADPLFTVGVVKKLKPDDGKVTIVHKELVDLEMPTMTMVFRVADEAMFEKLGQGAEIEFVAERVNGKLTVTDLK